MTVSGLIGAIGRTPLIRLKSLESNGCRILAKAEFMNPGGSVKDRAAWYIVKDAEENGRLRPGGTVVEGTAGNTGIGLAHICRARGYNCVIFMPDTQSREKIDLLRILGADVRTVPAVPFDDPRNYNHQAKRHAADISVNAVWTNQFDNQANMMGHFISTGPEIWEQTDGGKLDGFTCATGTGGTLAGVAKYLKSRRRDIKVFLADPPGSVLYSYIKSGGKLTERAGSSITEGIGQGRITDNLRPGLSFIDDALQIADQRSIEMVFHLLDKEGLFVGASSALNVVAAVDMAKQLGPGSTVVTMICDGAYRYQSRLFSKSWLRSKSLFDAIPEHLKRYVSLD